MPLTAIDPQTALVVIDLQKGIATPPTIHPIHEVVNNACALATVFRSYGLPVILVNVAGSPPGRCERPAPTRPEGWTELVLELNQQPDDHLVTKFSWGGFTGTGLDELLKGHSVTQIVLAGMATSMGVETTARQAFELGYNVTVAVDATTDRNADAYRNSTEWIFPKLAEVGSSTDIIQLLGLRRNP